MLRRSSTALACCETDKMLLLASFLGKLHWNCTVSGSLGFLPYTQPLSDFPELIQITRHLDMCRIAMNETFLNNSQWLSFHTPFTHQRPKFVTIPLIFHFLCALSRAHTKPRLRYCQDLSLGRIYREQIESMKNPHKVWPLIYSYFTFFENSSSFC